ncbi:DUF1435 domain-containing protein [Shimwellia pseudoproteus]|uniref:DUF1435 domain-containing protein n=1 Tax=Shimwellia pseudoproteus TaxID=570012 RepID=UPI0018EC6B2B|nr:DUF1435 domain-containing protein [Shimwellia pseudoproteus]MBJ3813553.1 DUF1435 domain-containing protein [Shimwellia pseudoproteus]
MLLQRLGSGWGIIVPGVLAAVLALCGLNAAQWRVVLVLGMLSTTVMLFNRHLRHYMLLPSCLTFAGGIMMVLTIIGGKAGI